MIRLLDLFCKAGGAGMGYSRAGFDVVGVDKDPQPNYPFEFHQADAFQFLQDHHKEFDVIHASPPCQKFMTLQNVNRALGNKVDHPDLIEPTRRALQETGKPYVIENVIGSPLQTVIIICGHALGLENIARHRCFESNVMLFGTGCSHRRSTRIIGVYGDAPDGRPIMARKEYRVTYAASSLQEAQIAMGIGWMTWDEIKDAIPPVYTEFIGRQLLTLFSSQDRDVFSTSVLQP